MKRPHLDTSYRPTPEQEKAIRAYVRTSIVPLIEQVIVKKLGQAMVFTAEQFELKEKVSHAD